MINKQIIIISSLTFIVILVGGFFLKNSSRNKNPNSLQANKTKVVVYKSPLCGCCVEHAAYLEKQDFEVKTVKVNNMDSIKNKYNISFEMQSCHTAIIGDYFIEGHVPIEAIDKLLKDKPKIDGIALPEMPAGAPGMPGIKTESFVIYAIKNGESSKFITL